MKNTKNQKSIMILLALMLIFTLVWVGSNVYHSYVNSTIELPLVESIIPIEGSFDMKTIEQIKTRKRVNISNDIIAPTEDIQAKDEVATSTAQFNIESNNNENGTESANINL